MPIVHVPIHKDFSVPQIGGFNKFRGSTPSVKSSALRPLLRPSSVNADDTGKNLIPYLDDFLVVGNSEEQDSEHLQFIPQGFFSPAWLINQEKSDKNLLRNSSGFSKSVVCFLPVIKQQNIITQISSFTPTREVTSLLELLTLAIPEVKWAQAHSRPHQEFLLTVWDGQQTSLDHKVLVPQCVKKGKKPSEWSSLRPFQSICDYEFASHWGAPNRAEFYRAPGPGLGLHQTKEPTAARLLKSKRKVFG